MGKSDRAFAYGLIGLLAGLGVAPVWIDAVLALVIALLVWTTINRLRSDGAPPTP
jgi:CDP-diacylglycerol--glycerol-3-phosphate 3-phosphatidyltransferase